MKLRFPISQLSHLQIDHQTNNLEVDNLRIHKGRCIIPKSFSASDIVKQTTLAEMQLHKICSQVAQGPGQTGRLACQEESLEICNPDSNSYVTHVTGTQIFHNCGTLSDVDLITFALPNLS